MKSQRIREAFTLIVEKKKRANPLEAGMSGKEKKAARDKKFAKEQGLNPKIGLDVSRAGHQRQEKHKISDLKGKIAADERKESKEREPRDPHWSLD